MTPRTHSNPIPNYRYFLEPNPVTYHPLYHFPLYLCCSVPVSRFGKQLGCLSKCSHPLSKTTSSEQPAQISTELQKYRRTLLQKADWQLVPSMATSNSGPSSYEQQSPLVGYDHAEKTPGQSLALPTCIPHLHFQVSPHVSTPTTKKKKVAKACTLHVFTSQQATVR